MCYLRESLRDSIFEPVAENAIKQFKARTMTVRDMKKPWSPDSPDSCHSRRCANHAYADFKRIIVWRNYKEFESRAVEFGIKGEREPFDNVGVVTILREWGEGTNADLDEKL